MESNRKVNITTILVFIVLFCAYIFPLGMLNSTYAISKAIFMVYITIYYILNIKKVKFTELIFISYLLILTIVLKNFSYILFISIPLIDKVIEKKEIIINYLKKSNILYICLLFTVFYSLLWFGEDGRYAYTAIKEINQSGLAIFCLGLLLLFKNKKIGIITLIYGLLTFSRSYYLACFLLIVSKTKVYNIAINKIKLNHFSYLKINIISSFLFVVLAYFYIYQYRIGNIVFSTDLTNKVNLLDYSNFFRFTAILIIFNYFISNPIRLLYGISSDEYIVYGNYFARKNLIPFKETIPHNLFFSHLKIYGIISVVETIYLSLILKKIVNNNNFAIYISIALYSVILGAGLYSYWLYLSVFVLLLFNQKEEALEL